MGAICSCSTGEKSEKEKAAESTMAKKPKKRSKIEDESDENDEKTCIKSIFPILPDEIDEKTIEHDTSSGDEGWNEMGIDRTSTDFGVMNIDDEESKQRIITGFKEAIQKGNDSLVMYQIQTHPSLNLLDVRFPNGDTPLHVAVRRKTYSLIIYLLEQGISPNIQNDKTGDTPIHTAARVKELNCITLLLRYNADVNIKNNDNKTALVLAQYNMDEDIIELLSPFTQTLIKKKKKGKKSKYLNVSKEEKSDDRKIQEIKISRTNPFSKLKRHKTQKALETIESINSEKTQLPKLQGWLGKKKSMPPYSWKKRWVIVKDSHCLWADKQITIQDPKNAKERKKFKGDLCLMTITEVKPVNESKSQTKFIIVTNEGSKRKTRERLFRAESQNQRDYWVKSLKIHINYYQRIGNIFRN